MNEAEHETNGQDTAESLRSVLKSQYHASRAILRETVEKCPEDLWYSLDQVNAFWQTAYHTLFFAHLYLKPNQTAFQPWKHHQGRVQHEDGLSGPPDPESSLPLIPEPYTRDQVLEYCNLCDVMVDSSVDAFDPLSTKSGFSWHKVSKLEHQIINIRHIQLRAAQLAARLRTVLNVDVDWVGAKAAKR